MFYSLNKCSCSADTSCTWLHCGHLCSIGHTRQKCLSSSRASPEYDHLQNGHWPGRTSALLPADVVAAAPEPIEWLPVAGVLSESEALAGGDAFDTDDKRPLPRCATGMRLFADSSVLGVRVGRAAYAVVAYMERSIALKPNLVRWWRLRSMVMVFRSRVLESMDSMAIGDVARCDDWWCDWGAASESTTTPADVLAESVAVAAAARRAFSSCTRSLRRCTSSLSNSVNSCR